MNNLEDYSIITNGSEYIAVFYGNDDDDMIHVLSEDSCPKNIDKSELDNKWETVWVCDKKDTTAPYIATLVEMNTYVKNKELLI